MVQRGGSFGASPVNVLMLERAAIVTFDDTTSPVEDLTAATGEYGFPSTLVAQGDCR